jgi:hypothetical protein
MCVQADKDAERLHLAPVHVTRSVTDVAKQTDTRDEGIFLPALAVAEAPFVEVRGPHVGKWSMAASVLADMLANGMKLAETSAAVTAPRIGSRPLRNGACE